ncbi:hypothetical protein [Streptomyces bluensis]|nr:hypothetical protein [Streptomyces bluensis]
MSSVVRRAEGAMAMPGRHAAHRGDAVGQCGPARAIGVLEVEQCGAGGS